MYQQYSGLRSRLLNCVNTTLGRLNNNSLTKTENGLPPKHLGGVTINSSKSMGHHVLITNRNKRITFLSLDPHQHQSRGIGAESQNFSPTNQNNNCEVSLLKLEKLKAVVLDQSNVLKEQNDVIEQQQAIIDRLRGENVNLRKTVRARRLPVRSKTLTINRKISNATRQRNTALIKKAVPPVENPHKIKTRQQALNNNIDKDQLEIIRLGPTSSKIRRVRRSAALLNKHDESVIKSEVKSETSSVLEEIHTPGWKVVKYNPASVLEGTEDITDDAYAKRHQKLYTEEKRLNRRDRMREKDLELYRRRSSNAKFIEHKLRLKMQRDKEVLDDEQGPDKLIQIKTIVITNRISNRSIKNAEKLDKKLPDQAKNLKIDEPSRKRRRCTLVNV